MKGIPPPQMTPPPYRRDQDHEPISESNFVLATMKDVKKSASKTEHRAALLFVLGVLGSLGGGFLSVRAIAQDAGRVEVVVVAEKQKLTAEALAAHLKESAERDARVERKLERQDEKQDLILDALRVPLWKRPDPEPKDGGK